jgi:hypothetical protein
MKPLENVTLVEGTHTHRLVGEGVSLQQSGEDVVVAVPKEANVVHEEHASFPDSIPAGTYDRLIVQEIDPDLKENRYDIRPVCD